MRLRRASRQIPAIQNLPVDFQFLIGYDDFARVFADSGNAVAARWIYWVLWMASENRRKPAERDTKQVALVVFERKELRVQKKKKKSLFQIKFH